MLVPHGQTISDQAKGESGRLNLTNVFGICGFGISARRIVRQLVFYFCLILDPENSSATSVTQQFDIKQVFTVPDQVPEMPISSTIL